MRSISREREVAMRAALGAGHLRLARQCLTESAVLGFFGGVPGILLAAFGLRPFVALWPGGLPRAEEIHPDWRVLAFAGAISCSAAFCSGRRLPFEFVWTASKKTCAAHRPLGGRCALSERAAHAALPEDRAG